MAHVHGGMGGMSMGGMDMGDMDMGSGVPGLLEFPKIYWAVVGVTIGIATMVNIVNILICRQRLAAARQNLPTPAKPKNFLLSWNATATAIVREASGATIDPIRLWKYTLPMPQVGRVFLVVANIVVLTVLCFVGFSNTLARDQLENIAYRIGFVCLAQIPLLFLLAGKNNIIGFLTGVSYEKLNWLHRWAARTLFLFVTIHFGYWLGNWWPYGSYVSLQLRTNNLVYWGLAGWVALAWIVLTSFAPVRRLSYEVFVIQHIITFGAFIAFTWLHLKAFSGTLEYLYVSIALFFFDRLLRAMLVLFTNISYFHPKQRSDGDMNSVWATKAEFQPLSNGTTKISIRNPPLSWQPGQHVFVSCHSIVPLQSHPFTIASLPQDGKMDFFIKAEKGATRRFYRHAEKIDLPMGGSKQYQSVAIEGPYGKIRPLRQFDTVTFFAGSTGVTFTMPLMRDIVHAWSNKTEAGTWLRPAGVVTRRIRFVWVVKRSEQLLWFSSQLSDAMEMVRQLRKDGTDVDLEVSVYCTCDSAFTDDYSNPLSSVQAPAAPMSKDCPCTETKVLDDGSSDMSVLETRGPLMVEKSDTKHSVATDVMSASVSTASAASGKHILHPSISVYAGRPDPSDLILGPIEQARGESAVVVCGPGGLVQSVRSAVVKLSDERAVHKGTGAQGIYLHSESFNY